MQVNFTLIDTKWVVYNPVDGKPSQPSSIVHTMTGISEYLDSTVLGNHDESSRVNNIFTTIYILENI